MSAPVNLSGQTFGRLTALEEFPANKYGRRYWTCLCSCGNRVAVAAGHLKSGNTKSCGCIVRQGNKRTHNLFHTPEWNVWHGMRQRCFNPAHESYKHYGGRGITVCDRWDNSMAAFAEDIGPRPSMQHSLDRINNDGNYEPGNCRWATKSEQRRNQRPRQKVKHAIDQVNP